jgi:SAM-dependent methyltransferase
VIKQTEANNTMESLTELFQDAVQTGSLSQAVLSKPKTKKADAASKVKIRPVQLKNGLSYQFTHYVGTKVLHENVKPEETAERAVSLLSGQFRQALLQTDEADYQILINKKGEAKVLKHKATKPAPKPEALAHNRRKNYILEEGEPVPFLVELGVMNAHGKVLAAKYDKFRQINRFLEMIDDVAGELPAGRTIRIVDFGCGKSYLTFAMYHYLRNMRGFDLQVFGLDLKEDVIRHCSALAAKLGFDRLRFAVGDIAQFTGLDEVDMVVTLHACDTATDAALEKAVRWDARIILSVPCCQHELFRQVQNEALHPLLKHGILKERFSALITDAARAQLLELAGYKTQLLEFIDMEHTPKNLLIRAVKEPGAGKAIRVKGMAPAEAESVGESDGQAACCGLQPVSRELEPKSSKLQGESSTVQPEGLGLQSKALERKLEGCGWQSKSQGLQPKGSGLLPESCGICEDQEAGRRVSHGSGGRQGNLDPALVYRRFADELHIEPYLERALSDLLPEAAKSGTVRKL